MLDDWMKKAKGTSIKLVAQWSGESDRTLQEMYFRELGKADETRTIPKVKHLGIDEISQLKGHGQYVLLLYDLDRHEVVEMLPDRRKETLIAYLEEHQDGFLAELEAVCIDMWQHYHDAVKAVFPHVDVVVDRFHVERQLNEALDECRRAKVKKLSDPEKKRLWKKEYRAILLRCLARQMSMPNGEAELDEVLSQDRQLKKLYDLKEQFRDIYAISNYQRASAELDNWLRRARYFGSKFLTDFIETVKRWKTEILGYIKHGITNGVSEGLNCKVKLVKRIGYGYRNFVNFRLRILHTCSETLIS
jgi:transposase